MNKKNSSYIHAHVFAFPQKWSAKNTIAKEDDSDKMGVTLPIIHDLDDKGSKTFWCGPWIGEFGWELFHWQAYIRGMSRISENLIVMGPPHHSFLYKDFAKFYLPYTPPYGLEAICHSVKLGDNAQANQIYNLLQSVINTNYMKLPCTSLYRSNDMADPYALLVGPWSDHKDGTLLAYDEPVVNSAFGLLYPEYVMYGNPESIADYDYILQIRNRKHNTGHNWDLMSATQVAQYLADEGQKVGFVGTLKDSLTLPNLGDDLRGMPLEEEANIYRNCKAIIGPSSGPLHFASLCGCDQITWSHNPTDLEAHETKWNPFKTKVYTTSEKCGWEDWDVPPEVIIEKIKLVEKENKKSSHHE